MLVSLAVNIVLYLIASLIFIIRYITNPDECLNDAFEYVQSGEILKGMFIATCISTVVMTIFLVLDLKLLIYHLWLISNNLTTYEHILAIRKREAQKLPQEGQVIPLLIDRALI